MKEGISLNRDSKTLILNLTDIERTDPAWELPITIQPQILIE